ncbi:helix-turn-helix domain-containing protein [Streptomyces sp. C11-1]|uniref:Helix-turn-helix domain-containing protein n=1 Tax=Streptomyces durocortorensis TaxID=2811104 RepID=A0ABY9W1I6_9ACTN|nr:helix-turn-helix domain-containing protein [Streptomyces durocortorensis]WNF29324.1 helix-turn-helix domain-containing protein [Streptomyces durocortorensis]
MAPDGTGRRPAKQQERSLLTRGALLDATAREIDRHGYGSMVMHRIAREAGVTTGALTFHFPTKGQLLAELGELGLARVEERVSEVAELPVTPLRRAHLLLLALLELLHRDVVARAAVRLSSEIPGADDWSDSWLRPVREMFRSAGEEGQLRAGVTPEAVTEMALRLAAGTEVHARGDGAGPEDAEAARVRFTQFCDLLLYGISAIRPPEPDPASKNT